MTAKVLNSDASLNLWKEISTLEFIPGETVVLKLQIFNPNSGLRYIPPATTIMTVTFNNTDGSTLEKTASLNADDRSLATINLTPAETEELMGGNILFELDELGDGTVIKKGVIQYALSRVTSVGGDCC